VLYDRPLGIANLRVCPGAWDAVEPAAAAGSACMGSAVCQAQDVATTVCPYGFWGLRHVLEQPLGRIRLEPGAPPVPPADEVVVSRRPKAAYCYDKLLDPQEKHREAIAEALGDLELSPLASFDDIHRALTRVEASLFYLLCHGELRGTSFVLKLRQGDAARDLYPEDLELDGQARPFVAIVNACDSVATREDVINKLVQALRLLGVVAVVGTEVEVVTTFAMAFGTRLVHELAGGRRLGEVLLQLRRETLAQGMDPSGLVYTAYGSADVRMG
jgi:hypothetical protein